MTLIKIDNSKSFEIKCKSATRAEIDLYGSIGEDNWGDGISAKSFSIALGELPKSVNQIDLRVNSGGGDVFDGMTIYNRLKQHKAKVTVYIDGVAASIASIIAMAGDEIVMGEGALMMIHKPWTMAMGDSRELEETIDRLNDVEEQMLGIYERGTGLGRAELRKMIAETTWFDADQALEAGFAQRKMANDETLDIAASINKAFWIKDKPQLQDRTKMVNNKLSEFKNKAKDFLAR